MSVPTPPWGRYAELRPEALAAIRAAVPVAYVPWGALEWHGPHLPFGLGGLVATTVAERVVRRTGGVLLPPTWWPVTGLPHADSLWVRSEVISGLWADILDGLAGAGWRVVVVVSGHVAPGHELALMDAAEQAMRRNNVLVLALPPIALVDEEMLDHGALWETSLLMALRADLVDLDALGTDPVTPSRDAVIGRDPRGLASASLGRTTLDLAVERIVKAVLRLLKDGKTEVLRVLYEERRERYQAYVECHEQLSPEAVTMNWWNRVVSETHVGAESDERSAPAGNAGTTSALADEEAAPDHRKAWAGNSDQARKTENGEPNSSGK